MTTDAHVQGCSGVPPMTMCLIKQYSAADGWVYRVHHIRRYTQYSMHTPREPLSVIPCRSWRERRAGCVLPAGAQSSCVCLHTAQDFRQKLGQLSTACASAALL